LVPARHHYFSIALQTVIHPRMQPQRRSRGRPRKRRGVVRQERLCAPSPSPSHAPSPSPSRAPSLSPSRAPSPSRSWAPSPSPSRSQPELDDIDNNSEESDTGAPKLWDPHAGLKPLKLDGHVSDADIEMEEDLPPGGEKEVRASMVEMMVDLEQRDDGEWLPPRLRKRTTRKTGMISSVGR
jgi:hypothetical protein